MATRSMPLSPSQRVVLRKEIAKRLGAEQWPLLDLTLKQFSLPWSDQWSSGSAETYVLAMIESAQDQSLIDLASHVGFHFEEANPGVEPPFWRKGMLRLFVSHLAAYREFAGQLQEALLMFRISGFVAHNDIEPTLDWQTQIETALSTCDALVALLHPAFHESNWTDQEIGFAMGRGAAVFSVHFGQPPYGFIGRFQAFNGNGKTATALARELFDAYRKDKQTQRRMPEALVGLFEQSGSFQDAKERIGYLEELETWEPSFAGRIKSAAEGNPQVKYAFGVPERTEALFNKWAKAK